MDCSSRRTRSDRPILLTKASQKVLRGRLRSFQQLPYFKSFYPDHLYSVPRYLHNSGVHSIDFSCFLQTGQSTPSCERAARSSSRRRPFTVSSRLLPNNPLWPLPKWRREAREHLRLLSAIQDLLLSLYHGVTNTKDLTRLSSDFPYQPYQSAIHSTIITSSTVILDPIAMRNRYFSRILLVDVTGLPDEKSVCSHDPAQRGI